MTTKTIIAQIQQQNPDCTDNQFLIKTWEKLGLPAQMGGVAFSELRYFLENSPNVESIGRYRRLIIKGGLR